MNINDAFPSKYLKSADLKGRTLRLKIDRVVYEQIGNDEKTIMYFQGKERGMVLNKTNALTIADQYGDEMNNWTGGDIELFTAKVDMQGKRVDGLRVRVPSPPQQASPRVVQNARPVAEPNPPAPSTAGDDPFDDDVPF